MAAKTKEFFNQDLEAIYNNEKEIPEQVIDEMLKPYPASKRMLLSVIRLVEASKPKDGLTDDWECDFEEVVWPEVRREQKRKKANRHEKCSA